MNYHSGHGHSFASLSLMRQDIKGKVHSFTYVSPNIQGNEPRGGTDLERGYGDVRPWRPPFHASLAARKGPISSKRVSSQDPLLRKFENFSLYNLNFHPNFSSQAPKFGNFQLTSPKFGSFQLTSPQIWKFFAHKPPFQRQMSSSQVPILRKSGPHTLTWKKVECPPPPREMSTQRGVQSLWFYSICNNNNNICISKIIQYCSTPLMFLNQILQRNRPPSSADGSWILTDLSTSGTCRW